MVLASVWILTLAVAAGTLLAMWHLRATDASMRPPSFAGLAHGAVGAAGLALLLLALQGPPRAVQSGAGGFGATAAWLFVASLVSGGVVWLRRRRGAAAWMAVHAGIAVTGYALLLAWDSLG